MLDAVDHFDEVRVPLARDVTLGEAARAFLGSQPRFARALMALRDAFARPLRLKPSTRIDPATPIEVGQRRGPFRVLAMDAREIVLGEDDRHLDFRVSLTTPAGTLVVATTVRYRNRLGRIYFAVVRPFHRMIVRSMARRAAGALGRLPSPE